MNIILLLGKAYLPDVLKRRGLQRLFEATAAGFGVETPDLPGMSYQDMLALYAAFTAERAQFALQRPASLVETQGHLYAQTERLGRDLRRQFRVRSPREALEALELAYRLIGVDLRGEPDGSIFVRHCYFSSRYTPEICGLISSLDAGLVAGLTGGGRLAFKSRITEGCDRCTATVTYMGSR